LADREAPSRRPSPRHLTYNYVVTSIDDDRFVVQRRRHDAAVCHGRVDYFGVTDIYVRTDNGYDVDV
jgi:hypothetical protein